MLPGGLHQRMGSGGGGLPPMGLPPAMHGLPPGAPPPHLERAGSGAQPPGPGAPRWLTGRAKLDAAVAVHTQVDVAELLHAT
jgi:hypothetical protein